MFSQNQQRRTQETPMDFEWHGRGHGPIDPHSPFPKLQPGQKGGFNNPPQTTNSFVAASPTKPAPQFRNPSFTTPRKPFDADLFSEASGVDSSPGDNADGEDTPDVPKTSKNMTIFTSGAEKQPIFGRYGAGFLGNSPGRADLRRGKYANALIANKARKRRRVDRDRSLIMGNGNVSESESEEEDAREKLRGKTKKSQQPHWFGSLLSGIESRPNLPNLLSFWLQLSLNTFLVILLIYGFITFWMTIRSDVDKAADVARSLVMAEIAQCGRDFLANGCGGDYRAPALEVQCHQWQVCMERDAESVGRARISAHTFAEIFNSFVEPISWKAMAFVVVIIAVILAVNNIVFGMIRSKIAQHIPPTPVNPFFSHPPSQTSYNWGAPPQTPQQQIGYDDYGNQGYQQIMPSTAAGQRSPSKGNRSPSKGDRY